MNRIARQVVDIVRFGFFVLVISAVIGAGVHLYLHEGDKTATDQQEVQHG